jgi:hypothetical protein
MLCEKLMLVCTTKHNRVQELYFRANQLTTRCHESLISDVSKKKRKTRTGWGTQSDGWERLKCNTGEDEDNGRAGLLIYLHGASLFSRPDIGLPSFSSKPLFLGRNSSGFPSLVIPTTEVSYCCTPGCTKLTSRLSREIPFV